MSTLKELHIWGPFALCLRGRIAVPLSKCLEHEGCLTDILALYAHFLLVHFAWAHFYHFMPVHPFTLCPSPWDSKVGEGLVIRTQGGCLCYSAVFFSPDLTSACSPEIRFCWSHCSLLPALGVCLFQRNYKWTFTFLCLTHALTAIFWGVTMFDIYTGGSF